MLTKLISKLVLTLLAVSAVGAPAPARACAFLDWLFCRPKAAAVAQTTYAPPYYGPPAVATMPAVGFAAPVTACAPPAVACPTQTCHYVAETHHVARPRPLLTKLFGPRIEQQVDPCTGCMVTTSQPRTGLFPKTVPTTTYRLVCSPTYAPAVTYSPGGMMAAPAVTMGVPACPTANCPPALPPSQTYIAPGPAPYALPDTGPPVAPAPQTFAPPNMQPEYRPVPPPQDPLSPVPDTNTRLNSTPAPLLVDPGSRTTWNSEHAVPQPAAVAVRHAVYQPEAPAPRAARLVEVQWQPASR